ncbi:DUF6883 domain-containing protein [Enterococcus sp. AZ126]|uniref:DUF6883 domain-containing protein n=1 Tax=Enterococcus sp. AZ126 TaxID=2774635 RepID=UPI003F29C018
MSIDMYLSASQEQASSVSKLCKNQVEGYNQATKAITDFVSSSPSLKGKAYDSGKNYFSAVLAPLVKGGILLSEAVEKAVKKFPEDYVAKVDSASLKESELEEQLREVSQLLGRAEATRNEINSSKTPDLSKSFQLASNAMVIGMYESAKKKIEEKLRKLREFHAQSPQLFSEISSINSSIATGLSQAGKAWNSSTGTFDHTKITDMTWATALNSQWTAREETIEKRDKELLKDATIIHVVDKDYGVDYYMLEKNGHSFRINEKELSNDLGLLVKKYGLDVLELSPTELSKRVNDAQKSGHNYFDKNDRIYGLGALSHGQDLVEKLKESGVLDAVWSVGLTVAAIRNAQTFNHANQLKNPIATQQSVETKLNGYLLNKEHPVGSSKANWFEKALGFNKSNSSQLSKQIVFSRDQAKQTSVTEYGTKYSQIIPVKGANGKTINIEFVWIQNNDGIIRLVTSIPTKR